MNLKQKVSVLKAVILDMDGVLVDTEPIHMDAFDIFLKRYNLPSNPQILEGLIGTSVEDNIRDLQENHNVLRERDHQSLVDERNDLFIDLLSKIKLNTMPGIINLLKYALDNKLKIALATSSDHNHADIVLRNLADNPAYDLDFPAIFDCVVGGDDVPAKKPAPDIYKKVISDLQISPENAFAVEDSVTGVRSAKGAGIFCFALRNPFVDFNTSEEDDLVYSVQEIVDDLIKNF